MEIVERSEAGIRVATLSGRLDTLTATPLEERLLPILADGGRLVADLEGVAFVSSAGLRVLLKAAKLARTGGGAFVLAAPQPLVREVLELSGFDRILPIHASSAEAVASLA